MNLNLKCVVVGDKGVGKTCLLVSYTTNAFPTEYVATAFDNFTADMIVDGKSTPVLLYDSAGQEQYDRLRTMSYPKSEVVIVCFSIVDHLSYENVKLKWHPEVSLHCPNVPIVLVGTKLDLRDDRETVQKLAETDMKPLSKEDGVKLQNEIGAVEYLECSSIRMENVSQIFDEVVTAILSSRATPPQRRKCSLQ